MGRPGCRYLGSFVFAVAFLLVGCGPSANAHRCADLFARALSTPDQTVDGAFTCLSAAAQTTWRDRRVSRDSDFRGYAAIRPGWRDVRLIGQQSDNAVVYEIHVAGRTAYFIVWLDAHGLVIDDNVAFCPIGDCGNNQTPAGAPAQVHKRT